MNGRSGYEAEPTVSADWDELEPYDGYEDIPEDFFDEDEEEAKTDNATPTIH